MKDSLKQIGVTGIEANRLNQLTSSERFRELRQGLEAYTNEVLADRPVSMLYHYWIDPAGNFFTGPPGTDNSFGEIYNIDNQFDPQERSNLPQEGFSKVRQLLVDNPQSVILWYSPPGPASFDKDEVNPYSSIHYDYGQLYIHYCDGEKVNAVAVKVTSPSALAQWIPNLQQPQSESQDEIAKSLLTPLVFDDSIDAFLDQVSVGDDQTLYTDKKGVDHSLFSIKDDIRKTFSGKVTSQLVDFDKTLDSLSQYELTEQKILTIYLETIQKYQQTTGNTILNLSGSCGGATVTSLNINQILAELNQSSSLPSIAQLLNPAGSKSRTLDAPKTLDCTCPFCKEKVQAKIQNSRISCPNCHKEAPYAC